MNGIDAVVLQQPVMTFSAVEAGIHAYAAQAPIPVYPAQKIENDTFTFWLEVPLALELYGLTSCIH
jgi:hydroxymethylglutaryl-CoA reductase